MRGNARAGAGRGEDDVFGDYYRKHRLQDPPGMRRARAGGRLEEAQQVAAERASTARWCNIEPTQPCRDIH